MQPFHSDGNTDRKHLLTSLPDVSTNFIYDYNYAHKSLQDQELTLLQGELKLQ